MIEFDSLQFLVTVFICGVVLSIGILIGERIGRWEKTKDKQDRDLRYNQHYKYEEEKPEHAYDQPYTYVDQMDGMQYNDTKRHIIYVSALHAADLEEKTNQLFVRGYRLHGSPVIKGDETGRVHLIQCMIDPPTTKPAT